MLPQIPSNLPQMPKDCVYLGTGGTFKIPKTDLIAGFLMHRMKKGKWAGAEWEYPMSCAGDVRGMHYCAHKDSKVVRLNSMPDFLPPLPKGYVYLGEGGQFKVNDPFEGLVAEKSPKRWIFDKQWNGLSTGLYYAALENSEIVRLNKKSPNSNKPPKAKENKFMHKFIYRRGQIVGILLAKRFGDHVGVGYSMVNQSAGDRFDKKEGIRLAEEKALLSLEGQDHAVPHSIRAEYDEFAANVGYHKPFKGCYVWKLGEKNFGHTAQTVSTAKIGDVVVVSDNCSSIPLLVTSFSNNKGCYNEVGLVSFSGQEYGFFRTPFMSIDYPHAINDLTRTHYGKYKAIRVVSADEDKLRLIKEYWGFKV